MPKPNNKLDNMKEYLSFYFQELSYAIENTKIKFNGVDELINFALLDIVTALFHAKQNINQERFIANLESILSGIKKYYNNKEKTNAIDKGQESKDEEGVLR